MNGRQEQDRRDGWMPDDRLEPLLDESLDARSLPGGVPAGLSDRVLAATAHRLSKPGADGHGASGVGSGETRDGARAGVLARIGPRGWATAAACVALAVSLGVWVNVPIDTGGTAATARNEEATLRREINALAEYNGPSDSIDRDLTMLAMKFDRHDLPEATEAPLSADDETEIDAVDTSGSAVF